MLKYLLVDGPTTLNLLVTVFKCEDATMLAVVYQFQWGAHAPPPPPTYRPGL